MITCQFENGNPAKLRHVTVNGIIIKDGKILLAKRGSYQGKPILESGKWALIGGFMDRDENLENALKREVKEETGWDVDNLKLFHIKDNPNRPAEDRQNVEFIFLAEATNNEAVQTEEVSNLQWFAVEELPPIETVAFDHGVDLELYKKYIQKPFPLPVLGK